MPQRYATVRECADYLKVTRQRVHQLIQKGQLGKCKKVDTPSGTAWLIPYPFDRTPRKRVGEYLWKVQNDGKDSDTRNP